MRVVNEITVVLFAGLRAHEIYSGDACCGTGAHSSGHPSWCAQVHFAVNLTQVALLTYGRTFHCLGLRLVGDDLSAHRKACRTALYKPCHRDYCPCPSGQDDAHSCGTNSRLNGTGIRNQASLNPLATCFAKP